MSEFAHRIFAADEQPARLVEAELFNEVRGRQAECGFEFAGKVSRAQIGAFGEFLEG